MKRRKALTGVILLFLITQIAFQIEAQTETVIIVNPTGENNYKTITEAIENAPNGATILIYPGEYQEILNIKKEITLKGENKETTIINPKSEENMYAIRIGTTGVTLKNLGITNKATGIYTTGIRISSKETTIENCNIYNTPIGILTWTSDNIIQNCNFWGCEDEGIALLGSKYSDCNNNIIKNCVFNNNCDGIELQYSSYNQITDCEFYDNTHTGIDAIASSNNENIILNCNIYKNMVHGIYLSSSSRNQIKNCYISENTDGNIIMNAESLDNQISLKTNLDNNANNNEPEEQKTSRTTLLNRITALLSRLQMNKMLPFFTFRSF